MKEQLIALVKSYALYPAGVKLDETIRLIEQMKCANCRHWEESGDYGKGICTEISESGTRLTYCDADLGTGADFYCESFQPKDE